MFAFVPQKTMLDLYGLRPLHSERQKLYGVLAFPSAIGLKQTLCHSNLKDRIRGLGVKLQVITHFALYKQLKLNKVLAILIATGLR